MKSLWLRFLEPFNALKAKLRDLWMRYMRLFLALLIAGAIIGNLRLMVLTDKDDPLTNALTAVFASLLSIAAVLFTDRVIRRKGQADDLARVLYEELADRVARCWFDYEDPWSKYLSATKPLDTFTLRKYSPVLPIIYPSAASQIALLEGNASQALIRFYFRLAAWERDLENIATDQERSNNGIVPAAKLRLLGKRLRQTLGPGLDALEVLGKRVPDWDEIDRRAIEGYDDIKPSAHREEPLRTRLRNLINGLPARGDGS